jgi:hypothetical protein
MRARRDEWIAAGVFDRLADEAIAGCDRIVGLDLSDCSIDGSQPKAPAAVVRRSSRSLPVAAALWLGST